VKVCKTALKMFFIISVLLNVALATACESSAAGATIYFDGTRMPKNIDPQLAYTDFELTVASNVFEGLFRMHENKVKPALCANYTISENRLDYEFTLINGAMWSDERPLTAHDFVFGLRRALNPETKAPYSHLLLNIKGASAALSGSGNPANIGISAVSDKILRISLEAPDDRFLEALCNPVSYPCNEEFFLDCKGRYGLIGDTVLSCGSFYLSRWRENANMRLIRNENYKGPFKAIPKQIIISFTENADERIGRLLNGSLDLVFVDGDQLGRVQTAGLNIIQTENTSYTLLCGNNDTFFNDSEVQRALFTGLDRTQCAISAPAYFHSISGLIPDTVISLDGIYRKSKTVNLPVAFDPSTARQQWLALAKSKNSAPQNATLYYPDNVGVHEIASLLAQSWQQNLGLYILLKPISAEKMSSLMREGNFQIALYPVSPPGNDAKSYLMPFASGEPLENYSSQAFKTAYANIGRNLNENEYIARVGTAEQALLDDKRILPIVSGISTLAISNKISGAHVGRSGMVLSFFNITKI